MLRDRINGGKIEKFERYFQHIWDPNKKILILYEIRKSI